jgi:tRNA pseudouridine55 synthase
VNGILLVDKPEGMSSAAVVRMLKPRVEGAKLGHLGTLDPFASGLLPLCVGEATKVARYLLLERKAYCGTIRLGVETDTLDRTGQPTGQSAVPPVSARRLEEVADRFVGVQRQVPPMFSALKRDGIPLYKLARRGLEVSREAREIEVARLTLTRRDAERIDFVVDCSKGTYVRVLAADIGRALGTVAHLETLRRTRVGDFAVAAALQPTALVEATTLPLVSIRDALGSLRSFAVGGESVSELRRGQQAALQRLPPPSPGEAALVLDPAGAVAGLIESGPGGWRVARMLGA